MQGIKREVVFPPVTIKLHWPDSYCKLCAGECEQVAHEIYKCLSCGNYSTGRTTYLEGKVIRA